MVIVYCNVCGVRVPDGELQSGTAVKDEHGNTLCAKCALAKQPPRPPSRIRAPIAADSGSRDTRPSRTGMTPARRSSRAVILPVQPTAPAEPVLEEISLEPAAGGGLAAKPKSYKTALGVGIGGAVFFLGAVLLTYSRKAESPAEAGSSTGTPAANAQNAPAAPAVAPTGSATQAPAAARPKSAEDDVEAARAERAARLLAEAKGFAKEQPQESGQYRDKLTVVATTYRATPAAEEAARLLAELPAGDAERKPEGQNLLSDPGLESGKWGAWSPWYGASLAREQNNAHSGMHCVRLNPGKAGCGQKLKKLTPNTNYLLTGWAKTGKGDWVRVGVKEYGAAERTQTVQQETYTQISVQFTTGADNTSAVVFCYKDTGKSYAYCDDFCLVAQGGAGPAAVAATPEHAAEGSTPPAQPAAATPVALLTDDLAWQAATNLMALVDLEKDAEPANVWSLQDGALKSGKCGQAKLHLPYQPATEYDLRATFTRTDGNDVLLQYLTGAGRTFVWVLNSGAGISGFSQVKGKGSGENASKVPFSMQNGRKCTTVVQVRADGVRTFLDGKLVTQWKTDFSDMSLPAQWKMHGDTALGLGSQNSQVTYHAIEVLDISGKGKVMREAGAPAAVAATAQAPAAKAEEAAALPALTAAEEAKAEYEKTIADVCALLAKDALPAARARLDKAKADPKLASLQSALTSAGEFAQYAEDLRKAALAGAALLADKRAFVFVKTDSKTVRTGKGSTISVLGVKDDDIQIEESLGGAKAQAQIRFEHLNAATRFALARIGLPIEPERGLKLAFNAFLLLQSGGAEVTMKEVRSHLEAARKAQAPESELAYFGERLAFYEQDLGGETAYRKVDELLKDKKWEEARAFIVGFRKEYLGTNALAKLQPTIGQHVAQIQEGLSPVKPGLWAAYWSGDGANKFKTFHLGRPETTLGQNWGTGSPDPKVPADNFGMRLRGILRIDRDGKYAFQAAADDTISLTIDGKKVVENWKKEGEITLAKGDHEISIQYVEGAGSASYSVRWRPEGAAGWQDVPTAVLWHDSRQTAKYEK